MKFDIILIIVIYTYIIGADYKYLLVEIPKDSSPALSEPDVLRQNGKPTSRGLKRIYIVQRIYILTDMQYNSNENMIIRFILIFFIDM